MYEIKNMLINEPHNRSGEPLNPSSLVVHRTGDTGATALNIRNYFDMFHGEGNGSSAHYVVDSNNIILCVPENEVAWHCFGANYKTIGIELCEPVSLEDYQRFIWLVVDICQRHGWDATEDYIKPHSFYDPVDRAEDPFSWSCWKNGQDPGGVIDPDQFYADIQYLIQGGNTKVALEQWKIDMGQKAADALAARKLLNNPEDWKPEDVLAQGMPNWLALELFRRLAYATKAKGPVPKEG